MFVEILEKYLDFKMKQLNGSQIKCTSQKETAVEEIIFELFQLKYVLNATDKQIRNRREAVV